MNKLGFLSLEYIVGDLTYWLTTGLGRDSFYFTQLPLSMFDGLGELRAHQVVGEGDYSEILVAEEDGMRASVFKASQQGKAENLDVDLFRATRLSWNELAQALIDGVPLADQSGLWHQHIVRRADPTLQINDVNYKVSAFLPPPTMEGVFAVCGEDYVAGTNPNWITFTEETEAGFKARLRQFAVHIVVFNGRFYQV